MSLATIEDIRDELAKRYTAVVITWCTDRGSKIEKNKEIVDMVYKGGYAICLGLSQHASNHFLAKEINDMRSREPS